MKNEVNYPVYVALTKIIRGISIFVLLAIIELYFSRKTLLYYKIMSRIPISKKVSASSTTKKDKLLKKTDFLSICLYNLSKLVIKISTPSSKILFSSLNFLLFYNEKHFILRKCDKYLHSSSNWVANSFEGTRIITRGRFGFVRRIYLVNSY